MTAVPVLLAIGPAAAQTGERVYDGMGVEEMRDLLLLSGLEASAQQVDGEAIVANQRVVVEDFNRWYVYFYNCLESGACRDMEFRVAWSDADPVLDELNDWNARNRFARAWRSPQGYAVLSMDVNLEGGVTADSVLTLLPLWRRSIARFANMLAEPSDD